MARLQVEAEPSDGIENYTIIIDGHVVRIVGDKGSTEVRGDCGDQSVHSLIYSFDGAPGESLSFTIDCGEARVFAVAGAVITGPGPHGAGGADFRI